MLPLEAARAFSCLQDESELESLYRKADSVVYVRLLRTELAEVPTDDAYFRNGYVLRSEPEGVSDADVTFSHVRGEYETIETFKGPNSDTGAVVDMPLGIGTGYVGLIPGVYYVFFFFNDETFFDGTPMTNMCWAKPTVFPERDDVQEYLEEIRALREK
jgi:hypothetical protein